MIGKKILNYEIKSLIGEGGMGNVYLGEHTQIGRKVAIKVLHQRLASNESLRERFRNEASAMALLQHPNIVMLHDYLESEDGLFLIMEYVEGIDLDDYIRKVTGPIGEEETKVLMSQLLKAFSYAHEQGVIHRDIKPSNILIAKNRTIKVLDFGIAKLLDGDKTLTKTGTQMGTVLYMSPEQVRGQKIDQRTDIYSLGVTLFQMVTGQAPYKTDTTEYEVYHQIVHDPLPKASTIYPGVSVGLENTIERATFKDMDQRFSSCEEFLRSILQTTGDKNLQSNKGQDITQKTPQNSEVLKSEVVGEKSHEQNHISWNKISRSEIFSKIQLLNSNRFHIGHNIPNSLIISFLKYCFNTTVEEFIPKYGKVQFLLDRSPWKNGKGGVLFTTEIIAIVDHATKSKVARKWDEIRDIKSYFVEGSDNILRIEIFALDEKRDQKINFNYESNEINDAENLHKILSALSSKHQELKAQN